MQSLRVGVDVGGTNTDAAVVAGQATVVGFAKVLTTPDITTGVLQSIQEALRQAGVGASAVQAVMLGTTHFVNACIQREGLARVGVIRLCGPATRSLPPFCDMPPGLCGAVAGQYALVSGGYEYDGREEISPMQREEVAAAARAMAACGVRSVVVGGVFSPANPQQEEEAGRVVAEEFAKVLGVPAPGICLSHQIGQLGLLERENAAILNAALLPLARRVVAQCEHAVRDAGVEAPLYFTANDGTLMSAKDALQTPVATFQSGPVNSLRGAAALSGGVRDGVVLDIGGTTTDVGVLVGGLPRPAPRAVQFAGVPTNFQMPDVFSIGLGGGSRIHWHGGSAADLASARAGAAAVGAAPWGGAGGGGEEEVGGLERYEVCSVGPDSVGSQLLERALCMGGDTPTATDVVVQLGWMELGDEACVEQQLPPERAQHAWHAMQRSLEWCVDRAKTHMGDVPVIVVGGGAPLCGEALAGASHILVPPHAAVANAVGAAIPQVSGSVDAVFQLGASEESRQSVLQHTERLAMDKAIQAGAIPGTCQVAVREEVPIGYLPGNTARIRIKVIGDLDFGRARGAGSSASTATTGGWGGGPETASAPATEKGPSPYLSEGQPPLTSASQAAAQPAAEAGPAAAALAAAVAGRGEDLQPAELAAWQPQVNAQGEWVIHDADLHLMAIGTGILGTGGGGSPHQAKLKALMELQRVAPGSMRVVHPAALPAEGLVVDAGHMGAPTVMLERLDSSESETAVEGALRAYAASLPAGAPVPALAAVLAGEVGGGNGIEPLVVGSRLGVPVVDGDLMGRAFPELQMMSTAIYGLPITPAALADIKGNVVVVQSVRDALWLERLLRPVCTQMGCSAGFASRPLTVQQLRQVLIPHSLSLAWRLGHAVAVAQHAKQDPASAIVAEAGGRILFTGKVVDVERWTTEGFARGSLTLVGTPGAPDAGAWGGAIAPSSGPGRQQQQQQQPQELRIWFQNENLVAFLGGECVASVPDLICCVESENGLPVSTEEMRYGLRVTVLGIPAHPLLTTPEGLAVVGPAAFGYPDVKYRRLGQYKAVRPIPKAPAPTAA